MIFIVGNSRSGTTMLGRIFGLNSQVYTFDELHFFEQQISAGDLLENPVWPQEKLLALGERLITSSREGLFTRLQAKRYRDEALAIIGQLEEMRPVDLYRAILEAHARENGKSIPLEQTPRYLFVAEEILERFPDSHVINIVRDPRDVILSQKNRWRVQALKKDNVPWIWTVRSWSNYHPYITSKLWNSAVKTAARVAKQHPRFHSITYEDLLQNPVRVLNHLCAAIGLPFEEQMLQVSQIGSSQKTDAPERRGLDKSRIGAWKDGGISKAELQLCEEVTGQQMLASGYTPANLKANSLHVFWLKASFPLKLALAGLVNLNRVSNLSQVIARRLR